MAKFLINDNDDDDDADAILAPIGELNVPEVNINSIITIKREQLFNRWSGNEEIEKRSEMEAGWGPGDFGARLQPDGCASAQKLITVRLCGHLLNPVPKFAQQAQSCPIVLLEYGA